MACKINLSIFFRPIPILLPEKKGQESSTYSEIEILPGKFSRIVFDESKVTANGESIKVVSTLCVFYCSCIHLQAHN